MKTLHFFAGLLLIAGSVSAQQYSLSTVAGTGTPGWSGDFGPPLLGQFTNPIRVAVDKSGNLYITDKNNYSIRKVGTNGVLTTFVGNGTAGFAGDGGPANSGSQISDARDVVVDSAGNVYIADYVNARVRKVDTNNILTTFAGTGTRGYSGDGGQASQATLSFPAGLATDSAGNVYIADAGNFTVRKVAPNGIITTIAGNGFSIISAFPAEGKPARTAILGIPYSLATDGAGNLYIGDVGLGRLFRVGTDGLIHTIYSNFPAQSFVIDNAGNLYYPNYTNNTVVKIVPGGTALWIGGDGTAGYSGDSGVGTRGQMSQPYGLAVDAAGNVYVAEAANAVIRKLTPVPNSVGAVANAASIQAFAAPSGNVYDAAAPISPGEIVVIFGTGMGPATLVSNTPQANGYFGTQAAGTTVTFNNIAAPLIYTSASTVAAIVPYALTNATSATVAVTYQGKTTVPLVVPVVNSAPGIFTSDASGFGQAAAVNQDGTLNGPSHPAPVGSFVSLYATGEGQTNPGGVDGMPAAAPLPQPIQNVNATVDANAALINYAGGAPTLVAGVMQVNIQIPATTRIAGNIPVQIAIGTAAATAATVAQGTNYALGDTGLISGCGDGTASYIVQTITVSGGAATVVSVSGGTGYAVGAVCTTKVSTGSGDGKMTVTINSLTGVASQLATIAVSSN